MKIITARPHRLLEVCIAEIGRLAAKEEACMLLVPSQYTLQAELEVMAQLGISGSFAIDVLSPSRLRSRVFERAGAPDRVVIDERGKCMVLGDVLSAEAERLTAYRVSAQSGAAGVARKFSAMIADLKRSGVSAQALLSAAQQMEEGTTRSKLTDVAHILSAYESRMAGQLADDEDVARIVREKMPRSGVMQGQHVFIYGFDMITPAFAQDIVHMAAIASSVTLLVETDKNGVPDGRLFAPVNASIERLAALANEMHIPVERETLERPLAAHADIAALERGLYALGGRAYDGAAEHIRLCAAATKRAEVHIAASRMRRMIEAGEDPASIALVYPRMSGYAPLLQSILPAYDLPVYIAEKRSAAGNPLCRFVLSALAVVSGGWRTADVEECVQSGFLPLSREEGDALCAYAASCDLRQQDWKRPFAYVRSGREEELAMLEAARERAVAPLLGLGSRLSSARTADDAVLAVMALLEETQAYDRLEAMREELELAGFPSEAEDCAQVWNRLMETLDQLHTLLGGRSVKAETMLSLLSGGVEQMELSALPPVDGAIICGEIGNVRTAKVSTLFAIGMNDAPSGADGALLTPLEAEETVRATGAYLGMSAAESEALAQLDELKTLSGAGERILLSYAVADDTGRALRAGPCVQAVRRLFAQMPLESGDAAAQYDAMLAAPTAAREALAVQLSAQADGRDELSGRAAQAYALMMGREETQPAMTGVTKKLGEAARARLDGVQARTLYGRPVMSVSRLETFAQCPYQYFVRYGLAPQREEKGGVDPAEIGTLCHKAAELFTLKAAAQKEFPDIAPERCDAIMEETIAPLIEKWRMSPLGASERGASVARRIAKTARRAARNIVSQYAGSRFVPLESELCFGMNGAAPITLELPDGTHIYLQGRIDRIDVLDGENCLRVIDYKTGAKRFDPTMVYWGLQLQLLLYLSAALEQMPGMEPAGFFYCRLADPTIRSESRVKEEIERQIAKKLQLSGISLSDVEILRAQSAAHAGMITRDGRPNARSAASMASREEMRDAIGFARGKAKQLAYDAYGGMIDDAPAERGSYCACTYCDYAAVCGFDPTRQKRRRLGKKTMQDLKP